MSARLVSTDFERFVARHFGSRGRAWLDDLPERVESYRAAWRLEIEHFLPGGLMSCCLAVHTSAREQAVLKINGPWTATGREALALQLWHGGPAPALLRADAAGGALLLERIVPGETFQGRGDPAELQRVARLLRALHAATLNNAARDQLPTLAAVVEERITTAGEEAAARSAAEAKELEPRLARARTRARQLFASGDGHDVLLHADLENKNILVSDARDLVAIDPLPCLGESAYDAAYWAVAAEGGSLRERRRLLATELGLDPERVRAWAAVIALEA
jgi:streptomycin 6-kinase